MSVDFYRESPGKFDSITLSRKTLSRWTGRTRSFISWVNRFLARSFPDNHTTAKNN